MGDECNVASRRSEDSPSSFSPTLGVRIRNLEESHVGEIPLRERDFLILSRQSGEPDEEVYKISDNKHALENVLSQPNELSVRDPLSVVPANLVRASRSVFPYFETKLRPDAPPFTPESLTRIGQVDCGMVDINDGICMERNLVPRSMIDDSCFVNIELSSSNDGGATSVITVMEKQQIEEKKNMINFEEIIKEPEVKTINVTSTPRLKRTSPKIVLPSDSLPTDLQIDESIVLAGESTIEETNARETGPEIVEPPPVVREQWRLLRTLSIYSNRIQIVVFIASLVVCMILVIYVVL